VTFGTAEEKHPREGKQMWGGRILMKLKGTSLIINPDSGKEEVARTKRGRKKAGLPFIVKRRHCFYEKRINFYTRTE